MYIIPCSLLVTLITFWIITYHYKRKSRGSSYINPDDKLGFLGLNEAQLNYFRNSSIRQVAEDTRDVNGGLKFMIWKIVEEIEKLQKESENGKNS